MVQIKCRFWFALALMATCSIAHAGVCDLQRDCLGAVDCESDDITLNWHGLDTGFVRVGNRDLKVDVVAIDPVLDSISLAGGTRTMSSAAPALKIVEDHVFGFIHPSTSRRMIRLTIVNRPLRYLDYSAAFAQRRVYVGQCEGLF